MENKPLCKGCSISAKISEDEINLAIEKLSKLRGIKFVDESLYLNRLKQCSSCKFLEYGTTCMQCGCIIQIKAKLPESSCPYPQDRRW